MLFPVAPAALRKSLLVDTIKELFEGSEALFAGLDVHGHWDWSVQHPVVRLDLSGSFRTPDELEENLLDQFADIAAEAGVAVEANTAAVGLRRLIRALRRHAGERVVVLVDEYDKPILDALATPDLARANRDFLHGVYSIIKACDADLAFVLLTGVSRFSKVSIFFGLNNLADITLDPRYSTLCGYTDDDLDATFADQLPGLDRQAIRDWYNGYNWLGDEKVYNPYTTSCCCSTDESSTPTGSRPAHRPTSSTSCSRAASAPSPWTTRSAPASCSPTSTWRGQRRKRCCFSPAT